MTKRIESCRAGSIFNSRTTSFRSKPILATICVVLSCIGCSAEEATTSQTQLSPEQENLRQQLEGKIAAAVENGFSGSVLVTVDDTQLVFNHHGLANREDNIPVGNNTALDFNPIAMDFTAAAIFKLEEMGQLNISDTIGSIFSETPTDKADITLEQIVQHRAGFDESHSPEGIFEPIDRLQARERILEQQLIFNPGADSSVSASGYTLLADIVETVSGREYTEFVRNELFEPAGMTQTGFYGEALRQGGQSAIGYDAETFANNDPAMWPYTWATVGNGGLVTTVSDFDRWLTNAASANVMSQTTFEAFNRQRQSYTGFATETFGSEQAIIYGNFGQFGQVVIAGDSPENGTRIIIASNAFGELETISLARLLIRTIFKPAPEGGWTVPLVFENAVENGFSGAVLVRYGDEILLNEAAGLADRESEIPNTTDTVFDMGSITKQYTGALIMALQEAGLLQVDDTLAVHFDDVPQDKADIMIHQLLTHTAGLPGGLGNDEDPISREDFLALVWSTPLDLEPGAEFSYSNVGYSIAAAIAEKVTGQSYEVALNERVFAPGNIVETGYVLPDWSGRTLAIGYEEIDSLSAIDAPWADDGPYWHLRGNGGLLTTTTDMLKWHDALSGESVLSASSIEALHSRYVDEGLGVTFYGYGWVTEDTPAGPMHWHDGGNGFYFAVMLRFVEENLVVIMLANEENEASVHLPWNLARAASPTLQDWISPSE